MTGFSWAAMAAAGAVLAAIAIAALLLKTRRIAHADAKWFSAFSPDRYRPMLRLLDSAELEWLAREPGSSAALVRRVRQQRVAIFRRYLRSLRLDFDRLQAMGRVLIGTGQANQAVAQALFQANWAFTKAWWAIQFRLALYQLGFRRVDAATILEPLRNLDRALRIPQPAAVAA